MNVHATRRQFLKGSLIIGGAAAAATVLTSCGTGDGGSGTAGSGQVVFADYGGTVGEARKKIFFDTFTEETGIKVVQANADPARYIMMGEGQAAQQWDGLDAENFYVARLYEEGLLAKLPSSVTRSDYVESPFSDYVTGGYNQSFNLGFSSDQLSGAAPDSWADFWNVSKFPGKRAVPGFAGGIIEAALIADGVSKDQLFPLDFERAFAKLDEIKDSLFIFSDFGEGQQMLQSGSASMALLPNGRVQGLIDQSLPIGMVWNEALLMKWVGFPIMENSPNKDNMFELVSHMATPELQVQFAEATGYGPVMSAAYDMMDASLAAKLPGSPEHLEVAVLLDAAGAAAQVDEYNTALTEWLAS